MDRREDNNLGKLRQAQFRKARRQQGYRETVIWLHDNLQRRIDALIAAGHYRNRSEALSEAAELLVKERTVGTSTR